MGGLPDHLISSAHRLLELVRITNLWNFNLFDLFDPVAHAVPLGTGAFLRYGENDCLCLLWENS